MHGGCNVGGKRPGSRRPGEQVFTGTILQWEAYVEAQVRDFFVAFSLDLHIRDAGSAAWAPGHNVAPLVDQVALLTFFEK